jgi:ribose 5-phosphate isomerase
MHNKTQNLESNLCYKSRKVCTDEGKVCTDIQMGSFKDPNEMS